MRKMTAKEEKKRVCFILLAFRALFPGQSFHLTRIRDHFVLGEIWRISLLCWSQEDKVSQACLSCRSVRSLSFLVERRIVLYDTSQFWGQFILPWITVECAGIAPKGDSLHEIIVLNIILFWS